MPATLPDRKASRKELTALILAGITDFAGQVYAYQPTKLEGRSPVCTVQSGGSGRDFRSDSVNPTVFRFIIAHYINRHNGAAEAEDLLDDLERQLIQLLRNNVDHAPYWSSIKYATDLSQPDIWLLENVEYRVEVFLVDAKVTP